MKPLVEENLLPRAGLGPFVTFLDTVDDASREEDDVYDETMAEEGTTLFTQVALLPRTCSRCPAGPLTHNL